MKIIKSITSFIRDLFCRRKSKSLAPEDVFTPRAAEVNSDMYIARPELEKALGEALRTNLHIVIHGESGTGKSWLYKQSFAKLKVAFFVANLANASRLGSIAAELKNLVDRDGGATKTGYEAGGKATAEAGAFSGEFSHQNKFQIGQMEPFEACLASLRRKAKKEQAVLVFDNLEAVFSSALLLKELADLIILCDDERYAQYQIKILIVGVPSGVKEYYYKTPHLTTVANRLNELPEVSRLSVEECKALVARGFIEKLKYKVENIDALVAHVEWVTYRIPQMVHEYCLEAAFLGEEKGELLDAQITIADGKWMSKSLYHSYAVVEEHMNERDTKAGRRNQALYALSLIESEQFKAPEVEILMRREFPNSTDNTALNVPQTLGQLTASDRAIIRRSPKGDAFTFADPRYRMVLRGMLRKTTDERVEKAPLTQSVTSGMVSLA